MKLKDHHTTTTIFPVGMMFAGSKCCVTSTPDVHTSQKVQGFTIVDIGSHLWFAGVPKL